MAKQLFEEEVNLTNTSVNSTPTSSPVIRRPNKFGNTKAGIGEFTGPQTRTVSENNPSRDELTKSFDENLVFFDENLVFFDENYIPNPTQTQITVSGKYSEVNYVTFNIPNLQSVRSISGNIYSGVIKKQFPVEELPPTDTSTSGTSATIGISGTNGTVGTFGLPTTNFLIPFGEPGTPGEIREFPPTGQLYIWNFNYNVGKWNIYNPPPPTTGGINDGSNIGNVGFDQSGGGGPVGGGNNLGGGPVTSGGGGPVGGGGGGGRLGQL
jgi:hypothetical protein